MANKQKALREIGGLFVNIGF